MEIFDAHLFHYNEYNKFRKLENIWSVLTFNSDNSFINYIEIKIAKTWFADTINLFSAKKMRFETMWRSKQEEQ